MSPELFIGLVTHPGTRFSDSSGPVGLAQRLSKELESAGLACQLAVSDQDEYEFGLLTIDNEAIASSIHAELMLEKKWAKFLRPEKFTPFLGLRMSVHERNRQRKYLKQDPDAGSKMVERLINIELAHLKLLNASHAAGAKWCLIIEDDADAPSIDTLTSDLMTFIDERDGQSQPVYVNLSKSFSESTLKTNGLLFDGGVKEQKAWPSQKVLIAKRPITNTVCAILYRGSLVEELLNIFTTIPLAPVVPIDWKLNAALMKLYEKNIIGESDCWFIEPGPIVQRSMHDAQ